MLKSNKQPPNTVIKQYQEAKLSGQNGQDE